MNGKKEQPEQELLRQVQKEAKKKVRMEKGGKEILFGFGAFGIIGWSVSLPVVLGILGGMYLDDHVPQKFSWTLTLLFVGLIIGCLNAWYWIKKNSPRE